jgi:hypothetical protein
VSRSIQYLENTWFLICANWWRLFSSTKCWSLK